MLQTNFQNCIRKCPNTEYIHKLLARIHVANHSNPSSGVHFLAISSIILQWFYVRIKTYAVDGKSVRQCKATSFEKEIIISRL